MTAGRTRLTPRLDPAGGGICFIQIWEMPAEPQAGGWLATMHERIHVLTSRPGFRSTSLHRGLDGTHAAYPSETPREIFRPAGTGRRRAKGPPRSRSGATRLATPTFHPDGWVVADLVSVLMIMAALALMWRFPAARATGAARIALDLIFVSDMTTTTAAINRAAVRDLCGPRTTNSSNFCAGSAAPSGGPRACAPAGASGT